MDREPIISVWGDSLSAPEYSWCKQLEKHFVCNMHVKAVGGLPLVAFDGPPTYLVAQAQTRWRPDIVCVYLGANDGVKLAPIDDVTEAVRQRLLPQMVYLRQLAKKRGYDLRVTLIKPPTYAHDARLSERMAKVRKVMKTALALFPDVESTNMPWGNYDHMIDEYHPDETLHLCHAIHMAQHWGLQPRPRT